MSTVKFAVVREDPQIELRVLEKARARSVLLVASGGCTALSVKHERPDVDVVAYDFNPAQIAHVRLKNAALASGNRRLFNVEDVGPYGLNQCGAFEGIFRLLRSAFLEWVAPPTEVEAFFAHATQQQRAQLVSAWSASAYWPAIFSSAFQDALLHAMFGPDATQHAPRGSYPAYFQAAMERGLRRADAAHNPFLQHIFLGCYRQEDAPAYLKAQSALDIELRQGGIPDMADIARFGCVHLSNIFDWNDDAVISVWSHHLGNMATGSLLINRQLNNQREMAHFLGEKFFLQEELSRALTAEDRSLFYNRIQVWQRR